MARVKVLEVAEAAGGGVLRHIEQIARQLDPDAFDLTLALSPTRMQDPKHDIERLRSYGVRVELVPMRRRPAPVADLLALSRLTGLMRAGGADVVHAHSSKAGFLARWAARRAGAPRVFYTPHAFAFQCGGVAGRLYERLERVASGFGGTVLAVSDGERDLAIHRRIVPPDRVRVVRNAIEPPAVPTTVARAAARAALGLPNDVPVVGTVGRLVPQKGVQHLLCAAQILADPHPRARFVLIGSGPLGRRLLALATRLGIGDRVVFAGHRQDAADLCAAMDVYVQPSLWEGLPYAVLDAMGRALPVVVSDVPGLTELVAEESGVSPGRVAPPARPSILADRIGELLVDTSERRALGQAGRERVLRDHALPQFIASIAGLYRGD